MQQPTGTSHRTCGCKGPNPPQRLWGAEETVTGRCGQIPPELHTENRAKVPCSSSPACHLQPEPANHCKVSHKQRTREDTGIGSVRAGACSWGRGEHQRPAERKSTQGPEHPGVGDRLCVDYATLGPKGQHQEVEWKERKKGTRRSSGC